VAKNLHKILKKELKYSAGSCNKRFIALMNDTATIPPELDDHPQKRQEEKAARTLAKLHDRHLQDVTDKQQKVQKRLADDQEKLKKALEKKARADQRARVAEEKARSAMQKAAIREKKAKELEVDRAKQEAQIQILREGEGIPTPHHPATIEKDCQTTEVSIATAPSLKSNPITSGIFIAKTKRMTAADLEDPRARLVSTELKALCDARGIPKKGGKLAIVKRLAEDDMKMGIDALMALLRSKGIPTTGTMDELVKRLAQADAQASAWGKKHLKALDTFWDRTSTDFTTAGASSNKRSGSPLPDNVDPKRVRPNDLEVLNSASTASG
jgi:hypothetical protein